MPHIIDELGIHQDEPVQSQATYVPPSPEIAWALDPFAPVDEKYVHLVNNPNESNSNTDKQEEVA